MGGGLGYRTLVAQVAQLVEHATENRSVAGSIPALGTILTPRHTPQPITRDAHRRAVTMVVQALSSFGRSRSGAMRIASRRSSPRTTGQ